MNKPESCKQKNQIECYCKKSKKYLKGQNQDISLREQGLKSLKTKILKYKDQVHKKS